jgi:hypothetical protein
MLSVIMLSAVMLSVIMLGVIMLSVVMLSVIILSVVILSVIILSVVMLSVVAPSSHIDSHLGRRSGQSPKVLPFHFCSVPLSSPFSAEPSLMENLFSLSLILQINKLECFFLIPTFLLIIRYDLKPLESLELNILSQTLDLVEKKDYY